MSLNFPVPEGLLDLLRDFTVAVVKAEPDDLERFAADYFRELVEAMAAGVDETVECVETPSFLEFDETMYGYRGTSAADDDAEEAGSHTSVAESQSHVESSVAGAPEEEKCPDEAARCWEKWMKEEGEEEEEETAPASSTRLTSAAGSGLKVSDAAAGASIAPAGSAAGSSSKLTNSATRVSAAVGDDAAAVRSSAAPAVDEAASDKSGN